MGSHRRSRRAGLSEVLGSLLMIGITLVAGAAVFGFVNSQTGTSAQAVGSNAASNINYLNEREVIVYASLVTPSPSYSAKIWIYNSGSINPENFVSVLAYDVSAPSHACTVSISASAATTSITSPVTVTLPSVANPNCPSPFQFTTTHSYTFVVIGQYGSSAQLTVTF